MFNVKTAENWNYVFELQMKLLNSKRNFFGTLGPGGLEVEFA
jgi:hypothetical protein